LSEADRTVVETVLSELSPRIQEEETEDKSADILALKKAKLKLLMDEF
jgi:hypothetical protein